MGGGNRGPRVPSRTSSNSELISPEFTGSNGSGGGVISGRINCGHNETSHIIHNSLSILGPNNGSNNHHSNDANIRYVYGSHLDTGGGHSGGPSCSSTSGSGGNSNRLPPYSAIISSNNSNNSNQHHNNTNLHHQSHLPHPASQHHHHQYLSSQSHLHHHQPQDLSYFGNNETTSSSPTTPPQQHHQQHLNHHNINNNPWVRLSHTPSPPPPPVSYLSNNIPNNNDGSGGSSQILGEPNNEPPAPCQLKTFVKHDSSPVKTDHHQAPLSNEDSVSVDDHIKNSSFTAEHVDCICESLMNKLDIGKLQKFLYRELPDSAEESETVLRARAVVAFYTKEYKLLYQILESRNFSPQYHNSLQKLWFHAHYKEAEMTRSKELCAVDKYRIRNKHELPPTIWDGEKTIYCFKDSARRALKELFEVVRYPNPEQKKQLSEMTGLTPTQVSNWFKNKRQRDIAHKKSKEGKDANNPIQLSPGSSLHSPPPYYDPNAFMEEPLDIKPDPLALQPPHPLPPPVLLSHKYYLEEAKKIHRNQTLPPPGPSPSVAGTKRKRVNNNPNPNAKPKIPTNKSNNKRTKALAAAAAAAAAAVSASMPSSSGGSLNGFNGSVLLQRNPYNNYIQQQHEQAMLYHHGGRMSPTVTFTHSNNNNNGRISANASIMNSPESPIRMSTNSGIINHHHHQQHQQNLTGGGGGSSYLGMISQIPGGSSSNNSVIHQNPSSSSGGSCFQQQLYAHSSVPDALPPMFHAYHHNYHYPPTAPSRA